MSDSISDNMVSQRTKLFQLPMEPDGKFLTLWLRFNKPSSFEDDSSGFGNITEVFGNPKYKAGKYTISPSLNGISDAIMTYDSPQIRTLGLNDFTITVVVNPSDLSLTGLENDTPRYVAVKADDNTDQWAIAIRPNGAVNFTMMLNGLLTVLESAPGLVAINQWSLIIATKNPGGSFDTNAFDVNAFSNIKTINLTVNGVDTSVGISTSAGVPTATRNPPTALPLELNTPNSQLTNPATFSIPIDVEEQFTTDVNQHIVSTNLFIGCRNLNGNSDGNFAGIIDDFRIYQNKYLSNQERSNLLKNGFTISNIPVGNVAIIGRWYMSLIDPTVQPPAPSGQIFSMLKCRYNLATSPVGSAPTGQIFTMTKHNYNLISALPTPPITAINPTFTNKYSNKGFRSG